MVKIESHGNDVFKRRGFKNEVIRQLKRLINIPRQVCGF